MKKHYIVKQYSDKEAFELASKEFILGIKRGRPTKLGGTMHDQLLNLLRGIRAADGRVTPLIVLSVAEAVVISNGHKADLFENGGTLKLDTRWCESILRYHLMAKKKGYNGSKT